QGHFRQIDQPTMPADSGWQLQPKGERAEGRAGEVGRAKMNRPHHWAGVSGVEAEVKAKGSGSIAAPGCPAQLRFAPEHGPGDDQPPLIPKAHRPRRWAKSQ